ncbi:flagellar hook-length control protein FliK [Geobacter sp. OR-1]|uniref:flagellar hook-length control protein FliK n=1 Tax=Geobacter sp. OR-1 TaxID=1266765 RepID=UPI00054361E9|nr:flagellar hook-length control protein FliK [Geobacter sp. OR-1]GAM08082.1 flagellar hook-length control protein FliK [Geobacter sp. OR-1]
MEISREAMKAVIAAVKEGTASILEAAGGAPPGLKLTPGADVSGEVLAKQQNGRFIVRVNGELLDMALPSDTKVGITLKMTYIGDQPRLTFAVLAQPVKGSEVNISSTSRWLGSFVTGAPESASPDGSGNLRSVRMFDSLPADTGVIAAKLKEQVRRSGVFYESHLERWADGSYPIEELLKEPQGKLSRLAAQPQAPAGSATNAPDTGKSPAVTAKAAPGNSPPPAETATTESGDSPELEKVSVKLPEIRSSQRQTAGVTGQQQEDAADSPTAAGVENGAPESEPPRLVATTRSLFAAMPSAPRGETTSAAKQPMLPGVSTNRPSPADSAVQEPLAEKQQLDQGAKMPDSAAVVPPATGNSEQESPAAPVMEKASAANPNEPATGEPAKKGETEGRETSPGSTTTREKEGTGSPTEPQGRTAAKSSQITIPADSNTTTQGLPTDSETAPPRPLAPFQNAALPDTATSGESAKFRQPVLTDPPVEPTPRPAAQNGDGPAAQPGMRRQPGEPYSIRPLPLIAPEIPKPDSLLNQPREIPLPAKSAQQFEPPDSQTLPVIRQQLETLHSGQFVWLGEAWQGQKMEWAIRRDEKRNRPRGGGSWDTELRLELPGLGAVSASVTLSGNQVRLAIIASDPGAAEVMTKHRQRLADGMESGGLMLAGMEVKHEPSS